MTLFNLLTRTGLVLSSLSLALSSCTSYDAEISRETVERVITTLAADDMEGRGTFTPGIEKAAVFLEGEFERIGLDRFTGLDSYRQTFSVYSLTPESSDVRLNGRTVDRGDYFYMAGSEQVVWTESDNISVISIGPDDDFASLFGSTRRGNSTALVLVNEGHRDLFNSYSNFMSRPRRVVDLESSGTLVFVLSNADQAATYSVNLNTAVEASPLANIAGMIPGRRSDEFVLIAGHYDHLGIRSGAAEDSIANGANDNASGTTAVVALAEYYAQMRRPERTLLFVAFTAEEMGGYGARYFSEQLDPDQIVAMFNIEMIGKPAVEGPNTAWITGFERSTFGEILQQTVAGSEYEFYPDPYPTQNLFFRSDNATLARLGVPAHSISTTPIDVDGDYHQVSDEVETLDLDHLTNTIKAIAKGAATIVSGEKTPTRVVIEE